MTYNLDDIKKAVDAVFDDVVALRRQIHMHPELSEQEVQTEALVASELTKLGIQHQTGVAGHGVVATIFGQDQAHAVGIRADMDALPMTEQIDIPYKSQVPGVMHACGHDIHTAILLGTARVLQGMREALPGSVKLFFQPSEETVGGAEKMIAEGCLQNPDVTSVIGLHVEGAVPVGTIRFTPGSMNAASCEFYVTVTGHACHGAHPSEGIDPLLPACSMVTSLQSIVTRRIEPAEGALITVGQFHCGTKNNIISGEAKFSGIIRALNIKNRALMKDEIQRMCTAIAESYGASCEIVFHDSYPSLENDDQLQEWLLPLFEEALGRENIFINKLPSMGADDFAYFCHNSRGLYYCIGVGRSDGQECYSIHNDNFYPDEDCIRTGILTEVLAALKILEEERKTW